MLYISLISIAPSANNTSRLYESIFFINPILDTYSPPLFVVSGLKYTSSSFLLSVYLAVSLIAASTKGANWQSSLYNSIIVLSIKERVYLYYSLTVLLKQDFLNMPHIICNTLIYAIDLLVERPTTIFDGII